MALGVQHEAKAFRQGRMEGSRFHLHSHRENHPCCVHTSQYMLCAHLPVGSLQHLHLHYSSDVTLVNSLALWSDPCFVIRTLQGGGTVAGAFQWMIHCLPRWRRDRPVIKGKTRPRDLSMQDCTTVSTADCHPRCLL